MVRWWRVSDLLLLLLTEHGAFCSDDDDVDAGTHHTRAITRTANTYSTWSDHCLLKYFGAWGQSQLMCFQTFNAFHLNIYNNLFESLVDATQAWHILAFDEA